MGRTCSRHLRRPLSWDRRTPGTTSQQCRNFELVRWMAEVALGEGAGVGLDGLRAGQRCPVLLDMPRVRSVLVATIFVAAACGTSSGTVTLGQRGVSGTSNPLIASSASAGVPTVPSPTTEPGPDHATVVAKITSEIVTLFGYGPSLDAKLAIIADGASLRSVVAQGMADPRAPVLSLRVTAVVLTSPSSAVATIDFFLKGMPAALGSKLEFGLTGGEWTATRFSYCALLLTGGLHCPT
jgi:hypothetical protein